MQENINDYEFCIKFALDNAKKRINLLEDSNKKCVIEEYREWLNDGLNKNNYHKYIKNSSVLLDTLINSGLIIVIFNT